MAKQRCGGKGKSGRRSPLHGGQDESVGEFKSVGRQPIVKPKRRRAVSVQGAELPRSAQGAAATLVDIGRILIPPPKARERTAAVCGAPAAAARRGQAFSDNSATLGIRTCCGWSFGHSRDPVVVPRCARRTGADLETTTTAA